MEITKIIETLQDPMGIPFYPFLFQFLMVLTFVIHITFVNLTLGSVFMAFYLSFKKDEYSKKLSSALIKMAPPFVSMSILFGVAPLLFVQVLYDPFFYTSSTLLGAFVILFVFIMMTAYTFLYISYFQKEKREKVFKMFAIISFILFLFSGFIIHSISFLSLNPDKWMSIYANGEPVNTTGLSLNYFKISRFLHFITPSFIAIGIIMMLYADYYKNRKDFDKNYLEWAYKYGSKLAFYFMIIQILIGIWFLLRVPFKFRIYTNPILIIGIIISLILLYILYKGTKKPFGSSKIALLISLLAVFFMSYAREILRMDYLSEYNYSIFKYKVNLDIGSTLLFVLTFLMGLVIISFLLYIPYRAGKVEGTYTAKKGELKWGKLSIGLMVLWLISVVTLGIIITIKNLT